MVGCILRRDISFLGDFFKRNLYFLIIIYFYSFVSNLFRIRNDLSRIRILLKVRIPADLSPQYWIHHKEHGKGDGGDFKFKHSSTVSISFCRLTQGFLDTLLDSVAHLAPYGSASLLGGFATLLLGIIFSRLP